MRIARDEEEGIGAVGLGQLAQVFECRRCGRGGNGLARGLVFVCRGIGEGLVAERFLGDLEGAIFLRLFIAVFV